MPKQPSRLKAARVLETLNNGLSVKLDGYKLVAGEDGQVLIEAEVYRYRGGEKTELPPRLLPYEVTLNDFVRACERMSDDEAFLLSANTALTKHNHERARP